MGGRSHDTTNLTDKISVSWQQNPPSTSWSRGCFDLLVISQVLDLASMDYQLTSGSCEQLQVTAPEGSPLTRAPHILQVLNVRDFGNPSNSTTGSRRFRLILSDGVHYIQSVLATISNLVPLVVSGHIQKNTVIMTSSVIPATVLREGLPSRR